MKKLIVLFLLGTIASTARAQIETGGALPPFGSFDNGAADTVNRENLNSYFSIPIYSGAGRGVKLNFDISYNSLIWQKVASTWMPVVTTGGALTWGWNTTYVTGAISFNYTTMYEQCPIGGGKYLRTPINTWSNFAYTEPNGTVHLFPLSWQTSCSGGSGTTSGYASDGTGFYMQATGTTMSTPIVYGASGQQIVNTKFEDTNGNYLSSTVVNSGETDWYDSIGNDALKIVTGSSSIQYQYMDTTGTSRTLTLTQGSFNIKTNFSCSNVVEYSGTASLPTSVSYPNGTSYSISYESTPGNSGYVTGRVSKITLPNGGYVQYTYGTTNDGINCSDGTVTNLTRTVYDGTNSYAWSFVRTQNGSNWSTTVTYPQMPYDSAANQSVFTFNSSGQEISEQIYQGSTSGTLLRTINTTWASNDTPATVTTILEDNSTQSEVETTYDNFGNLQVMEEHDFGSGGPGPILRTTNYTYLSSSGYTNLNIMDRVTEKTISDSSRTIQYREDTAYDGTTISPCPTGVPRHDDAGHGCSFTTRGNSTSRTTYTNASAPSGGVTKNSYHDVFGNLVKADADCCQTMSWNFSATTEYSAPDSVVRGPSGLQLTTSYTYSAYTGQLTSITDPNNKTTSFAYDLMLRPTTTTRPDSAQIVTSYDDTHHTSTTQNPIQGSSVVQSTTYFDGLGRSYQTSISDASNNLYSSTTTEYDQMGRPYNVSNPYTSSPQYWTETTFDSLGRVPKVILPDGSTATKSYSTNSITTTDPVGNHRKFQSDGLNRLTTTYEPDPTNGNSLTLQTSYSYSVLDQLATITQGSQTRTFSYDGMGRLTSHTLPESGTTSFQYNSYNQISQRTDARGVITTYTYDSMNRLYQISYNVGSTGVAATPTITYTYGTNVSQLNNGRILTLSDGLGTTTYTYDNLARTTQAQYVINGSTYTIGRQYNLAGEVTSLNYPSGRAVQRTYDAIGRLASMSDSSTTYANSFSYNTAQQRTNFTYGNSVTATIGYSPDRLQTQSMKFAGVSTVYNVTYNRTQNGGNNGQIASITDSVDSGRSINYAYDSLGRLSTAQTTGDTNYPQWGLSFTYDRYGNRLSQTVTAGTAPSNSVAVSATTNRISTAGYSYDANGNAANDGNNTITYDAENRLLTASGSYGSGTYSYGAFGIRAVKSSGGNTTVSIYDGDRVIAEYTNGTLANEYIFMGNHLTASWLAGTLYYHAFDHQSIRVILDSSGNIAGQRGHFPFGEDWYSTALTSRHFTSYVRDSESANDNAVHRFYVNRLGEFSSTDPMPGGGGNPQGFNLYKYAHNDPVNFRDPSGKRMKLDPYGGDDDDDDDDDDGGGGVGCDPTIDPTCGCNPGVVEGNPCPPPEPPPPPPPSLPKCFCQMKYRPVDDKNAAKFHATHSFWYIRDFTGQQLIISAGPSNPVGGGFLNDFINHDVYYGTDNVTATTWFNSGLSTSDCVSAEALESFAYAWSNNTYRYHFFPGPNSNTFAHFMASAGGFQFSPPPGSWGWYY